MQQALTATDELGVDALRVDFVWRGDRFAHVVSRIGPDEKAVPLFESVEGGAAEGWPPSPPLQSLSIETLADGRRAALLVGMAGRGHWSASVEVLPGRAAVAFDLACRISDGEPHLLSSYRLLVPGEMELFAAPDASWIEVRREQKGIAIVPVRENSAPSVLRLLEPATFAVGPQPPQRATTIRWKYLVQLLTDS